MADVLKVVAARIQTTSKDGPVPSLQPQPPLFGIIVAESSSEVGPLETRTVLWENTEVNDVVGGTVTDLNLDVIEDADAVTLDKFDGNMVLRIAPNGPVAGDPAGGTSREFTAMVVSVYRRTPIQDAAGTGNEFLLAVSNGTYYEDLATSFAVLKNLDGTPA